MIKDTLKADLLKAMKSAKHEEVTTIRYILSQLQNKEIEKQNELSEEEAFAIIRRLVKEIKDSLLAAEKGERTEAQAKYKEELALVATYLPPEISDEELTKLIKEVIAENEVLHKKNPQALTGLCVKELRSKADPGRIVGILRTL